MLIISILSIIMISACVIACYCWTFKRKPKDYYETYLSDMPFQIDDKEHKQIVFGHERKFKFEEECGFQDRKERIFPVYVYVDRETGEYSLVCQKYKTSGLEDGDQ